jgi:diguanylate cyclase (GGDEF)-like protein
VNPAWAAQQLTEYLSQLGACDDVATAVRIGVERAAEAFEAEAGAVIRRGAAIAHIGFPAAEPPPGEWGRPGSEAAEVPGLGPVPVIGVPFDDGIGWLALARDGEAFGVEEGALLRGMARALAQRAQILELLDSMRRRQELLERLAAIQRSIVHRSDLDALLHAIVEGAQELLGDDVVALRMIDDDDPAVTHLVAGAGLSPDLLASLRTGRVDEGVGGAAIAQDRLVVIEDYAADPRAQLPLTGVGVRAAMAAPVWRNGVPAGSLAVGSRVPGRMYGEDERDALLAFAKHASMALTDARNHSDAVHRALHDPLTGLPNRSLLLDRLHGAQERTARSDGAVGVLFLDLDGFKTVNDSLGHSIGDELLKAVARRIQEQLRAGDTAARIGGDEFAVLIEALEAEPEALMVAERMLVALRDPFLLDGHELAVRASIGVATAHGIGGDLLRDADLAMYQAKAGGRDRVVGFDGAMHAAMLERLALENDLRRALERDQFELAFQPIVDLSDGRPLAAEALIRWRHPVRGDVAPMAFIPLAEETGLIVPIGAWVLRAACRAAVEWEELPVSVNVSSVQLRATDFPAVVARTLRESGLAPRRLILEITESVLVQDVERTALQLDELKTLGVRIAIDDFGTGHSSLQYLQGLPIDWLKIPKPFIDELANDGEGVLARAILELGRSFGLQVIAEGIEVSAQSERLQGFGCSVGQGFLFAHPLTPDELERLAGARV